MENTRRKRINDKNSDNVIHNVIRRYDEEFKTLDESDHFPDSRLIDPLLTESVSSSNKSRNYSQVTNSSIHRNRSQNKKISYGITFIDCGQAMHDLMPESATNYVAKERETVVAKPSQQGTRKVTAKSLRQLGKSTSGNCKNDNVSNSNKKFIVGVSPESDTAHTKCNVASPLKKIKITATSGNTTDSEVPSNEPASNIPAEITNNTTSMTNNSSKTTHGPKDITSISNRVSSSLASSNTIVILEKDIDRILARNADKAPTETTRGSPSNNGNTRVNTPLQMCDAKTTRQQIEGQIIIRNGKKYLVKKVKSGNDVKKSNLPFAPRTIEVSSDSVLRTSTGKTIDSKAADNGVKRAASLSDNTARSTLPASSGAPSGLAQKSTEKPSRASRSKKKSFLSAIHPKSIRVSLNRRYHRTIETIKLVNDKVGNIVRMQTEPPLNRGVLEYRFLSVRRSMFHSSSRMIEDFERLDVCKLKERLHHLESIKEELRSVLSFMRSNDLGEKLRKVSALQWMLERCRREREGEPEIGTPENHGDPRLADWETEASRMNARCAECDKPRKPDAYIPGFSKLGEREFDYCLCYKQVCHECRAYEGDIDFPHRFVLHRNVHRRNSPHVCPDCQTCFPSAVSLEAHAWTACFHALRRRFFGCGVCEIDGFRDMESVTRHYVVMHSATKTACDVCSRIFSTYNECVDHCSRVHSVQREPVRLVECTASDVTVRWEDYLTYLEDFSGIRKMAFFKCPFCSLKIVANKHTETVVNRHIRSSHFVNLAKTVSGETFAKIFETKSANQSRTCAKVNDNCAARCLCAVTLVIPKIVTARTISSEVFEREEDSSSVNTENFSSHLSDTKTCANNPNAAKDNGDNDGKAKESLPKILNVVSMADLNPTALEGRIILPTNSESLQTELAEDEDKKVQRKDAEETATEVDVFESENAEETEAKTPDAINTELPLWIFESGKLPLTDVDNVRPSLPSEGLSGAKSEASATSRIKVVDIKKICKPDVASRIDSEVRGARDTGSSRRIPEPPPLADAPRRVAEAAKTSEPSDNSENVATSLLRPRERASPHAGRGTAMPSTRATCAGSGSALRGR